MEDLCSAEDDILNVLGFDIGMVTGIDVVHKLLEIYTPFQTSLISVIRAKAETCVKVTYCSSRVSTFEAAADIGVS